LRLPILTVRLHNNRAVARTLAFLGPLRQARSPNAWRTLRVVGLALATFLCAVAMYVVVGEALGVRCGILALCLIVSLVAVVRLLPISLGGLGVGEEAFVVLMGLFGVGADQAAPVALVVLGVGVSMSLLGGLLLLRRTLFVAQAPQMLADSTPSSGPDLLPFSTAVGAQGGKRAA
jgi:uncharacterized membrane protein YbhN (UPF0104 family)